ncbi:hypothetical protein LOD99_11484, partial [Oopsacas minuta]
VNIWAAFSSVGTFPLCIFQEILTAALFVNILEGHLITQATVFHGSEWFLVQDNDPKHTAKLTKAWIDKNMKQNRIDWPSQSQDVNPIKNLFARIKLELIKRNPKNIRNLKLQLLKIWERIDADFLRPYWASMPKRCQLVQESSGYKIKY